MDYSLVIHAKGVKYSVDNSFKSYSIPYHFDVVFVNVAFCGLDDFVLDATFRTNPVRTLRFLNNGIELVESQCDLYLQDRQFGVPEQSAWKMFQELDILDARVYLFLVRDFVLWLRLNQKLLRLSFGLFVPSILHLLGIQDEIQHL